jgi:Metallo-beta-lactamase superfamily
MKRLFLLASIPLLALATPSSAKAAAPDYSIQAIRYASAEDEVAGLVMGAPKGEKINIAMIIWLIRGGGRNILFDSGYHRDTFTKRFPSTEYIRPDEAVKLAGVQPEEITDIVISHSHWDHLGGIDLFPKAAVWIQKEEFRYYTGDAWQPGGNHGGIDAEDVQQLVKLNTEGRLRLVDGDNVEIFPGIRAYTGARPLTLRNICELKAILPSSSPPTIATSIATLRSTRPAPLFPMPITLPTSRTRST